MPSSITIGNAGDLIIAGVIALLLWRGLAAHYRAWVTFLVLQLARDIFLARIPFTSLRYARLFMATDVLAILILAWCVYQWFRLLATHYPGIKLGGTWFLNFAFAISFLICFSTVSPEWQAIDWNAPEFYLELLLKRVILGVLAVFMLLILLGYAAYRVRVRPNVVWHGILLAGYLWFQSALSLTALRSHLNNIHLNNSIQAIVVSALYIGWGVMMTRRGEEVEIEERLTEDERYQLDRLNDELLTLARRTMKGT